MWIHQVHRPTPNITILAPPGRHLLCWGSTPHSQGPNQTFPAHQPDFPYPGKIEEWDPRGIHLALTIWVGSSLPGSSRYQYLPPHMGTWVTRIHPCQLLSYRSGDPLSQRLGHHCGPLGRDHSGWSSQTRIRSRRCRNALSPLWRSHRHAHRRVPISYLHGYWLVALDRIYDLHPTIYLILQCGNIGTHEPTTLVFTPLSSLPPTNPTKTPNPHITRPRTCLVYRETSFIWLPNQNSIWLSEHLTITVSNQNSFQITQPGSIRNFQPKISAHHPSRVHREFLTKTPSKSAIRGTIENFPGKLHLTPRFHNHLKFPTKPPSKSPRWGPFNISQEISIWCSEFTPIHPPQQNSIWIPQKDTI